MQEYTQLPYYRILKEVESFGFTTEEQIYRACCDPAIQSAIAQKYGKAPYTHERIIKQTARQLKVEPEQVFIDHETGELIIYPLKVKECRKLPER